MNMSNISNFIKQKREKMGLSQKELSKKCNTSDSTIQRIESEKVKKMDWELLCKISKEIGVHPFELLKEAGYITDEDINPIYKLNKLKDLDNEEIALVQDYINFLLYKKNKLN